MNILEDIESLAAFKRETPRFVERLKKTGSPLVLTNKGKAELVVLSAEAYQALSALREKMDAIQGVRRGLASTRRGEGRPIREVLAEMEREIDESGE